MSDETYDPKKLHAVPLPEAVANQVVDPKTQDIRTISYPGKMSVAAERGVHGHFGGCAVKMFTGPVGMIEEHMNAWATANPFFLIVETVAGPHFVMVYYTRTLTDEEMKEFNEINQEAARLISERREAEANLREQNEKNYKEAEVKLKQRADDEYKELKKLAEVGRKCLNNHKKGKEKS